jgi:hypothetical protein
MNASAFESFINKFNSGIDNKFTASEAVGKIKLSQAEMNFYAAMMNASCAEIDDIEVRNVSEIKHKEFACVGAGIGGGFQNTNELHVMKYKQAMATKDKDEWDAAVAEEHRKMKNYNVWTPIKLRDVPPESKILTSTWAMKKKANGTY